MNLNKDFLETTKDTVHDLSLVIKGEAAISAQKFINYHWRQLGAADKKATEEPKKSEGIESLYWKIIKDVPFIPPCAGTPSCIVDSDLIKKPAVNEFIVGHQHKEVDENNLFYDIQPIKMEIELKENLKILSLARLQGIEKNASDIVLPRLISSALNTLYLSQQKLNLNWKEIIKEIQEALSRGVKVNIILSATIDSLAKTSSEGYMSKDAKEILKLLTTDINKESAINNLKVVNLRTYEAFNKDETSLFKQPPYPRRNHAKVIIVDEKYAYIGSHNLYSTTSMSHLSEFGFIIFDENKVKELVKDYWEPCWSKCFHYHIYEKDLLLQKQNATNFILSGFERSSQFSFPLVEQEQADMKIDDEEQKEPPFKKPKLCL